MLAAALLLVAAAPGWDATPWLADLAQIRTAIDDKYANRDWLTKTRGVDLDALFMRAEKAVRAARDDGDARRAFDRMIERIADGHVSIRWPSVAAKPVQPERVTTATGLCRSIGYDATRATPGMASALPGYRALPSTLFPTGMLVAGGRRVGVVRIGLFEPSGYPSLCESAVATLKIDPAAPCAEECENAIVTAGFADMTRSLARAVRRLRAERADVLLLDISDNGGGAEWAEAAARMLTGKRLQSARLAFVRGPHWAKHWAELADRLRGHVATAHPADRARLLEWAAMADAARTEAQTPCRDARCNRLGQAGFATGLVGQARAGDYLNQPWGAYVFSAGQHDYRDGEWRGPLIVLINQETWSAAEEVAAMLQDNRAAIILGERSGGAGCGHTFGGTPTTLSHSGAVLELPDCARLRADGSNEVAGIVPDVSTGGRANDGASFAAKLIARHLPRAVEMAVRQQPSRRKN